MTRQDDPENSISDLLSALREGQLDEPGVARMDELLLTDSAAREYYADYVFVWSMLGKYMAGQELLSPDGPDPLARSIGATEASARPGGAGRMRLALIAAAAAIAASVLTAMLPLSSQATAGPQEQFVAGGLAVVTMSADARWDRLERISGTGSMVGPGPVILASGLAQLEFLNGARAVLEGPAELEIMSTSRAVLHQGRIRAHVPSQARGFVITTPRGNVVDLGTEFGLAVDRAGAMEIHVFEGEVRVEDGANRSRSLVQGEALRLSPEGVAQDISPNPANFVDSAQLMNRAASRMSESYQRWLRHQRAMQDDPSLVLHYTFAAGDAWLRSVINEAAPSGAGSDGALIGCEWARGRWPEKNAVEFKCASDRVRLRVPGSFEALTLAAWVRFDAFDRPLNSLLLADGFEPGEPHWQVTYDGRVVLGIGAADEKPDEWGSRKVMSTSPPVIGPGDLGRWLHLTSTYDNRTGEINHYLDGRRISREKVRTLPRLVVGDAEIGNWNTHPLTSAPVPIRNLNGRIDEFAIFSRAVQPAEVQELYVAGRPAP